MRTMNRRALLACAGALGLMGTGCTRVYEIRVHGDGLEKLKKIEHWGTRPGKTLSVTLYRCAEAAKNRGMPYFVLYQSLNMAAADRSSELPLEGRIGDAYFASAFVLPLAQSRPGAHETQVVLDKYASVVTPAEAPTK